MSLHRSFIKRPLFVPHQWSSALQKNSSKQAPTEETHQAAPKLTIFATAAAAALSMADATAPKVCDCSECTRENKTNWQPPTHAAAAAAASAAAPAGRPRYISHRHRRHGGSSCSSSSSSSASSHSSRRSCSTCDGSL